MTTALPLRVPIESFILTTDEKYPKQYKLLYFDPRGERHEILVRKSTMDTAISKLDGKPRAIARSTGGLSVAYPYQIVLHHSVGNPLRLSPEIRIKVRFKDFAANEKGRAGGTNVVTVTKNVLPEDVLDPISLDVNSAQKFLIDFGQGTIPISIFGFVSDQAGENFALFVESDAIERSIREPAGRTIPIVRYRVSKDLVRLVRGGEGNQESFEAARKNYLRLKQQGLPVIPEALQVGPPIQISTGLSFGSICDHLRRSAHRWNRQEEDNTQLDGDVSEEGCVTSDFLMYMEPI